MKCFSADVCIYTCASSLFLFFCFLFHPGFFVILDIDVCIYSTCAFLIVKWILMLIMYSAASL